MTKYVKKIDGTGYITDATGKPIPAELFDADPSDTAYDSAEMTDEEAEAELKSMGL